MDSLPPNIWLRIILSCGALVACAIFSFMETSITALRLFNLKELAKKTGSYKKLFSTLELEPHRVLIAILIANCVSNVIAADLITDLMEHSLAGFSIPSPWNFVIGVAIATTGILIFGEVVPKNLAQGKSDTLFQSTLWLTNVTFYLLSPLVTLLSGLSRVFVSMIGSTPEDSTQAVVSEKEIQFLIEHIGTKGQMDSDKSEMLHSIFDLADTTIKEIMVPEIDVVTLNVNTSLTNTLEVFAHHHFSRLPVYENKPDNIIGMVHQKDLFLLLAKKEDKPLKELVRPILFVPESMKVNQLLRQFKQQRHHIAMVLNEYGGIIGLVTLEDALEEIVGDINDEHESVDEHIVPLENGGWLVYAGVDLESVEQTLGITFKTKDAITLGGFLTEQLQHLPRKGEELSYKNYIFQIQKATQKRIIQVLIYKDK